MVPQQRKSRSQSKMGRAHKGIQAHQTTQCPNCAAVKLPHIACEDCGYVRPGLQLQSSRG